MRAVALPLLSGPRIGASAPNETEGKATDMSIIAWLVLGALAGWLAGLLVRGDEGLGIIGHIVLGIVGAIVGGWIGGLLFNKDVINGPLDITSIVFAVIGAIIVVIVVSAVMGRTRTGRGAI
jgi:uncharacterized membrane protein YeaQ/YmgE (transglycosylase-associated protein family)